MQTAVFDTSKFCPTIDFTTGVEEIPLLPFIADVFKTTVKDIIGKSRKQNIIYARHIARFCYFKLYQNKLQMERLGFSDYCTIIHSINTVNNLIDTNAIFRAQYFTIEMEFIYQFDQYVRRKILERKPNVFGKHFRYIPSSVRPVYFRVGKTIGEHFIIRRYKVVSKKMVMDKKGGYRFVDNTPTAGGIVLDDDRHRYSDSDSEPGLNNFCRCPQGTAASI